MLARRGGCNEAKQPGGCFEAGYLPTLYFSAQQDSIKKANMKRENKAYSFKEQIIELELKEVSTRRFSRSQ